MTKPLFDRLLAADAPDFVQDQVRLWILMAEDHIRADERDRIVAWLRNLNLEDGDQDWFADQIELGEHLK